jgi:hypothetical protein
MLTLKLTLVRKIKCLCPLPFSMLFHFTSNVVVCQVDNVAITWLLVRWQCGYQHVRQEVARRWQCARPMLLPSWFLLEILNLLIAIIIPSIQPIYVTLPVPVTITSAYNTTYLCDIVSACDHHLTQCQS